MSLVPPTATRVPARTAEHVNQQIRQQIEANVGYFPEHRDENRWPLDELDQEWTSSVRWRPTPRACL